MEGRYAGTVESTSYIVTKVIRKEGGKRQEGKKGTEVPRCEVREERRNEGTQVRRNIDNV